MPELPDVEIFKREAKKALLHKINVVKILDDKVVAQSPKKFNTLLTDHAFTKLKRKEKYLFLYANEFAIVSIHFGMTGYLQYLPEEEADPDYTAVQFIFDNQHKLDYISKRKLGKLEVVNDEQRFLQEKDVGKDAFDIEEEEFIKAIKSKSSTIKSALMDQSAIAGIGNVYSDEILYQAQINPMMMVKELNRRQLKNLFYYTKSVLNTAIEREVDITKFPEHYLIRHRKAKARCPVCNGPIKSVKVNGRSCYYCENCQQYSE